MPNILKATEFMVDYHDEKPLRKSRKIEVSEADAEKLNRGMDEYQTVTVVDLLAGQTLHIGKADCGSGGCRCALSSFSSPVDDAAVEAYAKEMGFAS